MSVKQLPNASAYSTFQPPAGVAGPEGLEVTVAPAGGVADPDGLGAGVGVVVLDVVEVEDVLVVVVGVLLVVVVGVLLVVVVGVVDVVVPPPSASPSRCAGRR